MKVYLSGPMSSVPEHNYPLFNVLAQKWRSAGHEVINPAENFEGDRTRPRPEYLREDVQHVLDTDAIAMLPGWEYSAGAKVELAVALELGHSVWHAETGYPFPTAGVTLSAAKAPYLTSVPIEAEEKADGFTALLYQIAKLHDAKKSDYTGGRGHPLANYAFSSSMVGLPPVKGMFMRICEKVYRIKSILEKGGDIQVANEGLDDTFLDIGIISMLCKLSLTPGSGYDNVTAEDLVHLV